MDDGWMDEQRSPAMPGLDVMFRSFFAHYTYASKTDVRLKTFLLFPAWHFGEGSLPLVTHLCLGYSAASQASPISPGDQQAHVHTTNSPWRGPRRASPQSPSWYRSAMTSLAQ